jgi:hypothetical protein
MQELRQSRLYAEEAFEKIYYANKKGVDKNLTDCFTFACRRMDYTAFRSMIAYETVELWNSMGKRPDDGVMWGVLGSQITFRIHGRVMDMMDEISAQKELLRKNWLNEYTDFRLATALGLFDCEQQFWLNIQWKLKRFESRYDRSTTDMPELIDLINN